jgi:hypothetical protein
MLDVAIHVVTIGLQSAEQAVNKMDQYKSTHNVSDSNFLLWAAGLRRPTWRLSDSINDSTNPD